MENDTVQCDTCLQNSTQIYTALLTTSFFAMVPANGWKLWSMRSSTYFLTQKMDLLKFSLLLNDLVLGLAISLVVLGLGLDNSYPIAQHLWGFSVGLMAVGRPLIQCSICVERYLAVLHPHTFLRYRPLRYRAAILALVFLVVSVCCCAGIVLCASSNKQIYYLIHFFAMALLMFLAVDSFCCLSILWVLHRPGVGDGAERNIVKKRAFNTVVAIQITMMLCYMPPISGAAVYYLTEVINYCLVYTIGVFSILITSSLYSLCNLWPNIQACVSTGGTA